MTCKKGTPKESPKQQNCKCVRLGLIKPVHERKGIYMKQILKNVGSPVALKTCWTVI